MLVVVVVFDGEVLFVVVALTLAFAKVNFLSFFLYCSCCPCKLRRIVHKSELMQMDDVVLRVLRNFWLFWLLFISLLLLL